MSNKITLIDDLHEAYIETRLHSLDIDTYTAKEREDLYKISQDIRERWLKARIVEFKANSEKYKAACTEIEKANEILRASKQRIDDINSFLLVIKNMLAVVDKLLEAVL